MDKKILFLVLLGVVLIPAFCSAADLTTIITNAASSLTALILPLSTISFMIAGIMYLSATGNPGRLAIAKGALIAAVVGIVIIVLASGAQDFVKAFFKL